MNEIILANSKKTIVALSRSKNIVLFNNSEYDCPDWRKFHTLCYFAKSIEKICFVSIAGISAPDGNYYKVV